MRTLRLPLGGSGKILSEKSPPATHSSSAGIARPHGVFDDPFEDRRGALLLDDLALHGLSFTHKARLRDARVGRERKNISPLEDLRGVVLEDLFDSVRAMPSRKTTSTLCDISLTPETTSVRPGTRAVIRPKPRGPASATSVGWATVCGRVSTATNEAMRSGGFPFTESTVSPESTTSRLSPARTERSAYPSSTVTVARSLDFARTTTLPPIFGSTSPVRPATSMRNGSAFSTQAAELADDHRALLDVDAARGIDDDALSSPRSRLVAGPSSNDARAPRALLTSVPSARESSLTTAVHFLPS